MERGRIWLDLNDQLRSECIQAKKRDTQVPRYSWYFPVLARPFQNNMHIWEVNWLLLFINSQASTWLIAYKAGDLSRIVEIRGRWNHACVSYVISLFDRIKKPIALWLIATQSSVFANMLSNKRTVSPKPGQIKPWGVSVGSTPATQIWQAR